MDEHQADLMISLLETISDKLDGIKRKLNEIESNTESTWDLKDVCVRLDDIANNVQ